MPHLPKGVAALLPVLALAALALAPAACRSSAPREKPSVEIKRISDLADPRAGLALDVDNAVGPVDVIVDPSLTDCRIEAETYEGDRRIPTNPSTWAVGELTLDNGRPVLRVAARPSTPKSEEIRLMIRVPSSAGLRVRNTNGPVTATGVQGSIDIASGTANTPGGNITLRTRGKVEAPVSLATTRGSILWVAERGTAVAINARSAGGGVEVNAPNEKIVGGSKGVGLFTGAINDGTNTARLASTADIRVFVGVQP